MSGGGVHSRQILHSACVWWMRKPDNANTLLIPARMSALWWHFGEITFEFIYFENSISSPRSSALGWVVVKVASRPKCPFMPWMIMDGPIKFVTRLLWGPWASTNYEMTMCLPFTVPFKLKASRFTTINKR